jgi:hypothetical protein
VPVANWANQLKRAIIATQTELGTDPAGSLTDVKTRLAVALNNNGTIKDDAVDSAQIADGAIDTAHIADDQITLAKMASGTDGNIISYDASGNPVAIATGSDGQVLTSAGAGQPPAFENAAGGGGKILQVQYQTYGTEQENNTDTWAVTGLQKAITPAHTSNKILVMASIRSCYKASNDTNIGFRLKRAISGGATTYVVLDDMWGYTADGGVRQNLTNDITYVDAPSTTAEITYDIEFRSETDEATCRVQNSGTVISCFVLMEVDGT